MMHRSYRIKKSCQLSSSSSCSTASSSSSSFSRRRPPRLAPDPPPGIVVLLAPPPLLLLHILSVTTAWYSDYLCVSSTCRGIRRCRLVAFTLSAPSGLTRVVYACVCFRYLWAKVDSTGRQEVQMGKIEYGQRSRSGNSCCYDLLPLKIKCGPSY